jgi:subtilisin family serine protease
MTLILACLEGRADSILETRHAIAVIDTGIDLHEPRLVSRLCKEPGQDFTGEGLQDINGHGTNIAWNVIKDVNPKKFCLMILKYYQSNANGMKNLMNEVSAFEWAVSRHVYLINLSSSGDSPFSAETSAIMQALKQGVIVVVAAGNNGRDIGVAGQEAYPACSIKYMNFHVVGSLELNGQHMTSSNYGTPVTDWALGRNVPGPDGWVMSGTSQATALVSNRILKEMQ